MALSRNKKDSKTESQNIVEADVKVDEPLSNQLDLDEIKGWPRKRVEELERCQDVCGRVFASKKDITSLYDDLETISLVLASFGELGRKLFHKVYQLNTEYKETEADEKFTNILTEGKFENVSKFFSIVKSHGIETKPIRTISSAAADGAIGAGYEDMRIELPEGCIMSPELRTHIFTYSFLEHNNQYYYARFDNSKRTVDFQSISNFIFTPLFLVESRANPKRIVEITNIFGVSKVLDVDASAFVSPQILYAFIEGNGNFLFDGNRTQLQKVKSKIYNLTKNALPLSTLGWQKHGFYAFCNGIYTADKQFLTTDDYGIVEYRNNNFFIPAFSSIYKDEEGDYESQKKFIFIKNKINFKEWSAKFIEVHGENGKVGFCFYLASLFRDIIFQRLKMFPHLFGFGPPATGKSALGWSMSAMFGIPQVPFNLNSGTKVAFHKSFSQFRNSIVWFDEFLNIIDPVRQESLKMAFDGAGHNKSEMTEDNRTKTTPVYSAAYISGQEMPVNPALFSRTILLQYQSSEYTEAQDLLLKALRVIEENGLSHITAHISTLRPFIEENFFNILDLTIQDIKIGLGEESHKIEGRLINSHAIILATFRTLQIPLAAQMPFEYTEILKLIVERIGVHNGLMSNTKDTSQFWEQVQFLYERNFIHDEKDFKIETKNNIGVITESDKSKISNIPLTDPYNGGPVRVLYLRLSSIHPLYLKTFREQHSKNGMARESLIHYLKNEKFYIGRVNSTRFGDKVTNALCFNYDMLERSGIKLNIDLPGSENEQANKSTIVLPNNEKIQFENNTSANPDDDEPF